MATSEAKSTSTAPRRGAGGRPPASMAGQLDARLLDAATAMFLELGYDAASCAKVAGAAGIGKATLYARYPNKAALFAAVVRRNVERTLAPGAHDIGELALTDRLHAVGVSILRHSLQPPVLAMMRMVIATAPQFPELAQLANRIGRSMAVERVAAVIGASPNDGGEPVDRATRCAERFVELIFPPHQLKALMGEPQDDLHEAAPARVQAAIDLLRADDAFAGLT